MRKCGVCMSVFFSRSEAWPARCSFEGFEQILCRCLLVDFDAVFSVFSKRIALSDGLDSSHFLLGSATVFAKLRLKIAKSKNRRKSLCAPLRIDSRNILIKFHRNGLGHMSLHGANSKCQTS